MNDLISRQAAIDEAKEWIDAVYFEENDKRERKAIECFIGSLKNMPSAQPEIIRCKDCKHYYFADNRVPSEQSWVCDAWGVDQTAHMGYCFKAERKTVNEID